MRLIDADKVLKQLLAEYNDDDSDYPTPYQRGLSMAYKIVLDACDDSQYVIEQVDKPTFDMLVKLCLDDDVSHISECECVNQRNVADDKLQKALDYFNDYIERSKIFLESGAVWDERTKNIVRNELKHYKVMVDFVESRINRC